MCVGEGVRERERLIYSFTFVYVCAKSIFYNDDDHEEELKTTGHF